MKTVARAFFIFSLAGFPLASAETFDCDALGLTKAQCRILKLVGSCALEGKAYIVEEGRMTVNGRLIGTVKDGEVIDEDGKELTEYTKLIQNECKSE